MSYPYEQIFAGDPSAPERVAVNGVVTIFEPGDATMAPLTITTLDGLPLANPMQVNESGFGPAFQHDTLDQVAWAGGGFTGVLTSYKGMKEAAVAASVSARDAAVAAQMAAENSTAPTAEAVEREIVTEGTAARTAVEFVASQAAAQAASPKLDKDAAKQTYVDKARSDSARVALGSGALASLPDAYNLGADGSAIAFGYKAMGNMEQVKKSIAIGPDAMSQSTVSRDNIAIGESALRNVQSGSASYSQADRSGTRNIGIGGNALHFAVGGYGHVAVGRNAGHCVVGGTGLVAIGSNANGGNAPIGLTAAIENGAPWGADGQIIRTVAVGNETLNGNTAPNVIGIGGGALNNNKKSDNNVAVGANALRDLDSGTGFNGGMNVDLNVPGTYTQVGTTLTLTFPNHSLQAGDIARLRLLDGASQTFASDIAQAMIATAPNANTVTTQHPVARSASGTAHLYGKESGAQQPRNEGNVAVGASAGIALRTATGSVAVGRDSLAKAGAATHVTAMGRDALANAASGTNSVAVGYFSGGNISGDANQITAVGASALRNLTDGTPFTGGFSNVAGIGYDSRVSGSNQVQLGNSASTTYVYGTVQNRSDARDKADIRDTKLGLGFIEKLRPVDYRWDMREDYDDHERDGSKKRERFHHGFIAQEVQQVIEDTGEDFGGLQDHSINGGSDVLSIGYDEVIAPLVKAVQELTAKVRDLEGRGK